MANLLRQVPPYKHSLTNDDNLEGWNNYLESEGSGSTQDEDGPEPDGYKDLIKNLKEPNDRLYYYVEDRKR